LAYCFLSFGVISRALMMRSAAPRSVCITASSRPAPGAPEAHEALLVLQVLWIVDQAAQRIAEDHHRLLEGDAVLRLVAFGLVRGPLEFECHASIYLSGAVSSSRRRAIVHLACGSDMLFPDQEPLGTRAIHRLRERGRGGGRARARGQPLPLRFDVSRTAPSLARCQCPCSPSSGPPGPPPAPAGRVIS
jgi:hypothetical protein